MWLCSRLLLPVMLLFGLSLLTTGCEHTRQPIRTTATTTSSACAVWPTISYSGKHDTPETVRQVIASNAARASLCPQPAQPPDPG